MKNYSNEDYYQTSDLAQATTLSFYFPIKSVDKTNPKRVVFVFKRDKDLDNHIEAYWRGELKVEPQQFFNQLKTIKTRIYSLK